jgi:hypothetical protein
MRASIIMYSILSCIVIAHGSLDLFREQLLRSITVKRQIQSVTSNRSRVIVLAK